MIVTGRRRAISQSMDLFIIIAAVLGVGGIVSASVYNLVNSATANASIAVVGASVVAGSGSSAAPSAISLTIKNNGGNSISCTTSTCQVIFAGSSLGGTPGAPCSSCIVSSPSGWTAGTTANAPLTFTFSPVPATLAPGAQASILVSAPVFSGGTLTGMPTHGSTVTLNIVFGTASDQITVTAQ